MVKLTEVEDEHFAEKPAATKDDTLLASDDDDDYTDTGTRLPLTQLIVFKTSRRLTNCGRLSPIRRRGLSTHPKSPNHPRLLADGYIILRFRDLGSFRSRPPILRIAH